MSSYLHLDEHTGSSCLACPLLVLQFSYFRMPTQTDTGSFFSETSNQNERILFTSESVGEGHPGNYIVLEKCIFVWSHPSEPLPKELLTKATTPSRATALSATASFEFSFDILSLWLVLAAQSDFPSWEQQLCRDFLLLNLPCLLSFRQSYFWQ